jgi:hypothetical protein
MQPARHMNLNHEEGPCFCNWRFASAYVAATSALELAATPLVLVPAELLSPALLLGPALPEACAVYGNGVGFRLGMPAIAAACCSR